MTNITDDYHSIPAKSAAIFAYAKEVKAKWAFKTDDDSFVNIPELLNTLGRVKPETYVGRFHMRSWPFRDPNNKWYVSETQYPSKLGAYPPFAAGVGYAFRDTALECMMNQIATSESYPKTMWLEDVYMGLLAKECTLKQKEIGKIHLDPTEWKRTGNANADFILVHYMKPGAFRHMYKILVGAFTTAEAEDPLGMCSYDQPKETCEAGKDPGWKVYDQRRPCELQMKRMAFTERAGSIECCKEFCEKTCGCVGIDYFTISDWCNLFDKPCPHMNGAQAKEGSSHHQLTRSIVEP